MRIVMLLLLFFLWLSPLMNQAQENNDQQENEPYEWSAKVKASEGVGWFILAEPIRDYEVLQTFELDFSERHIQTLHFKQVKNVFKYKGILLGRENSEIDGFVTEDGVQFKVISYTDQDERHTRIANVQTVNGKEVYLFSDPLKVNKKAFEVPFDGYLPKEKDFLMETVENLVKKAKKRANQKGEFDALVINQNGVTAVRYFNPKNQ